MQPHTGATVAVINYLLRTIIVDPEDFSDKTFNIRTSTYLTNGSFFRSKYHDIRTKEYSPNQKVMKFESGKDYTCYMEVRHDLSFEKFEFITHRHTYVREKFILYRGSENFSGEYVSELGYGHKISGRKLSHKKLEFIDAYKDDKSPNQTLRFKYDIEILSVISNR